MAALQLSSHGLHYYILLLVCSSHTLSLKRMQRGVADQLALNLASTFKGVEPALGGAMQGAREMRTNDKFWVDQHRLESLKLYCIVIGAICKVESHEYILERKCVALVLHHNKRHLEHLVSYSVLVNV